MSHVDKILWAFQQFGGKISLGQALKHEWGYKFCSRLSDLRKRGYEIECIKATKPSDNLYVLKHFEENGQGRLL